MTRVEGNIPSISGRSPIFCHRAEHALRCWLFTPLKLLRQGFAGLQSAVESFVRVVFVVRLGLGRDHHLALAFVWLRLWLSLAELGGGFRLACVKFGAGFRSACF